MYCPSCGKPTDANVKFCPNCGAQVAPNGSPGFVPTGAPYATAAYPPGKLMRPRFPRMIGGVCAAFALQYGWDVTLVRVLTAVTALLTSGFVGLAYLAAWVIIPEASYVLPPEAPVYPPPGDGSFSTATPPPPSSPAGSSTV